MVTDGSDSQPIDLEDELHQEFAVERVLLSSGVPERVMHALPRVSTPAVRMARALAGMVMVAAVGCVGMMAAQLNDGTPDAGLALQMTAAAMALTIGILMCFAAPQVVRFDAQVVEKLTGRLVVPGPGDVVLVRCGALAMTILAAVLAHI